MMISMKKFQKLFDFSQPLVWSGIIYMFTIHFIIVYTLITRPWIYLSWKAWLWVGLIGNLTNIGLLAGSHRLWSHKAYKATLPLRVFLMGCVLMSGQYSVLQFCRDHRLHHKYSDTNADPHNINRGIFFGHSGWLLMKRHPEVKAKGKELDLSDLYADPVIAFQNKFYYPLVIVFASLPSVIPILLWNESFQTAFYFCFLARYVFQLNTMFCINSMGHSSGTKPFNKNIIPAENMMLTLVTMGEGFHNFHHTFPSDYRTGMKNSKPNITTLFIDICAKLGLAYDLKEAPQETVDKLLLKNIGTTSY